MSATDENTYDATPPHRVDREDEESHESLYKHAFWLFGVLVGLAIGEVLRGTVPHVVNPPAEPAYGRWLDSIRLIIFLIVIIRFYLGSAVFFDDAYIRESKNLYPKKSYGIDFLFGIIHFTVFFAWAVSIDIHTKPPILFPAILGVILMYDLLWLLASSKYDTRRLIRMWTFINLTTLALGGPTYIAIYFSTRNPLIAELGAFFWVLLASCIDLAEITTHRKIFRQWLSRLLD